MEALTGVLMPPGADMETMRKAEPLPVAGVAPEPEPVAGEGVLGST
jgi:hypothetical protein